MRRTCLVKRLSSFLFIASIAVLPLGEKKALADEVTSEATSIPTTTYTNGQQQVLAPDWSKITWGSLPPIKEPGWIQFSAKFVNELGYDPSRVWLAGDRPEQFLMLGDVQDAFHMEAFTAVLD